MVRTARMLLAGAVCLLLAACTTGDRPEAPATPSVTATDGIIRMAAVGDSITAADSPDIDGGDPGQESWVSYAAGPSIEYVGGWAVWGATTGQMAEGITEPFDADVLVILAGTNDGMGTPPEQIAENLTAIVDSAGVSNVVLSSVPPIDPSPGTAEQLNARLENIASENGWFWVDSTVDLRDEDGRFVEGMAYDGVHPTEEGARIIGEAIQAVILEAFDPA
ncbi:GDSL-type esterase/lipase family protein [uncultured Agrococcus sp.]|uniref:SGNH/GDSL hydrolase family protein n=1 Tax=uncultured Agrococcus sp. TaxID=382258 RepID=UPI0025D2267D|nr:GDSL-type esterase/lipase family protein [uncultured Agrococcus sp.]